jgi:putative membrane protein
MLDSLQVNGFGAALLASLLYSACGMVIDAALQQIFRDR